jgi:hypothetical protein
MQKFDLFLEKLQFFRQKLSKIVIITSTPANFMQTHYYYSHFLNLVRSTTSQTLLLSFAQNGSFDSFDDSQEITRANFFFLKCIPAIGANAFFSQFNTRTIEVNLTSQ